MNTRCGILERPHNSGLAGITNIWRVNDSELYLSIFKLKTSICDGGWNMDPSLRYVTTVIISDSLNNPKVRLAACLKINPIWGYLTLVLTHIKSFDIIWPI